MAEKEMGGAVADSAYGESKIVIDDGAMWRRRALELEKELKAVRLAFSANRRDTIRSCARVIGEQANLHHASAQEFRSADDRAHRISEAIGMLRAIRHLNEFMDDIAGPTQVSEERPAPASSSSPSVPNAPVPDTQGKE